MCSCCRLGLVSLAYLWQRDQKLLLEEMLQAGVSAVVIKVACLGLKPTKHLGRSLEEVYPYLCELVCVSHTVHMSQECRNRATQTEASVPLVF